jgi:hypothetical protein
VVTPPRASTIGMSRRLVWFATGVGVGVLVTRRVSSSASQPGEIASGVARRVRHALDDTIADARVDMRRREARLREVLAVPERAPTGTTQGRR